MITQPMNFSCKQAGLVGGIMDEKNTSITFLNISDVVEVRKTNVYRVEYYYYILKNY